MEEDRVYQPPQFIVPLRDVNQIEGGKVHFEARIEPVGDPTMRVEWFLNGKLVVASMSLLSCVSALKSLHKLCTYFRFSCQQHFSIWFYCLGFD